MICCRHSICTLAHHHKKKKKKKNKKEKKKKRKVGKKPLTESQRKQKQVASA